MITAKDDFMFDREMMQDLVSLAYKAGLSDEEISSMFDEVQTVRQYNELQQKLSDMQLNPLERVRRGQTLSQKEISKAVKEASKRSE